MRVYDLANTTGTGGQATVTLQNQSGRDEAILQLELASTGTVTIQGRIDSSMSWIDIAGPYTADTLVPLAFVPEVRANIAANGSGVVVKLAVG